MLRKLFLFLFVFSFTLTAFSQETRHFTFHYAFTVKNLPAGKKVRIWIPAAQSDQFQEVKVVSANGDLPLRSTRESKYDSDMYVAEAVAPQSELHFDNDYDVVRHERVGMNRASHVMGAMFINTSELRRDLGLVTGGESNSGRLFKRGNPKWYGR